MTFRFCVFTASVCSLFTSCSSVGPAASPSPAVLERLYFGRAIGDTGLVSDSLWTVFVRDVVTPGFPKGFTVWRAEGQWQDSNGSVVREPSYVMEIVHMENEPDTIVVRIIDEYKRWFHQQAVLRVVTPVRASF